MSGISVRACLFNNLPPCPCSIRPDSRIAFAGPWVMEMNSIMDFRERLCELEAALPSVSG